MWLYDVAIVIIAFYLGFTVATILASSSRAEECEECRRERERFRVVA